MQEQQINYSRPELRTVQVTRYVTPLREGGSLPAIAEANDGFLYVLKFRGAGQGIKALIAELIGGEIARRLRFKVPELVFAELNEAFGRTEPDEEIQDLLKASTGLNLALHYLSGSVTFDPVATSIDTITASGIVWLDSLLKNVDRTARNTNMLWWHKELWLIDHGAALYFHHSWHNWQEQATRPFPQIKDHVLLPLASALDTVNESFGSILTPQVIEDIVGLIPDEWLLGEENISSPSNHSSGIRPTISSITPQVIEDIVGLIPDEWLLGEEIFSSVADHRQAYIQYLNDRITHSSLSTRGIRRIIAYSYNCCSGII